MSRPTKGLTLVELLVVLAIVSLLAALLFPAVQAAREAARRVECTNNVRQIGLSFQDHHDAFQRLPPGWISYAANGNPGWGWSSMLLQFSENHNLLNGSGVGAQPGGPGGPAGPGGGGGPPTFQINHASNKALREAALPAFLCPSDPSDRVFTLYQSGPGGGGPSGIALCDVARTNYAGVFGTDAVEAAQDAGSGCFYQNSATCFSDILDGLSNTLLVGEHGSRLDFATWVGAVPGAYRNAARVVNTARRVPNHVPNDLSNFSSFHPGGANFVLCDGSTKMVSDEIDLAVFQALATRAGRD